MRDLSLMISKAYSENNWFPVIFLYEQPPPNSWPKIFRRRESEYLSRPHSKKRAASDKQYDDAEVAMLDAMAKINKAAALDTIYLALDTPDYLVRKKALELLDDPELLNKNPNVASVLTLAREKHSDEVMRYDPKTGTKLGQVLNTDADYRRALSRKNGTVKAVVTTEKGVVHDRPFARGCTAHGRQFYQARPVKVFQRARGPPRRS